MTPAPADVAVFRAHFLAFAKAAASNALKAALETEETSDAIVNFFEWRFDDQLRRFLGLRRVVPSGGEKDHASPSERRIAPPYPAGCVMDGEIAIAWSANGLIGRVSLDGEHWASVEWSEKRNRWCIEDVEGRCLAHAASIRGSADSKEAAIALAQAMIRDGRMPSPKQARAEHDERRRIAREKRARRPAEQKRQADRQARLDAFRQKMDAEWREQEEAPLYEALNEAFDLADPELWKSNSFASLKPRLVIYVTTAVADLEWQVAEARRPRERAFNEQRLERARAILEVLKQREGA
jgi:hypothetical protein